MLRGADIILKNILHIQYEYEEFFTIILWVPQNAAMGVNNVMTFSTCHLL